MSEVDPAGSRKGATKKKAKLTPNKERQISLRLSSKAAKRLSKLTEHREWTVTQVIEEALKVFAAHEGIDIRDTEVSPSTDPP